jgi:hypothetical protein
VLHFHSEKAIPQPIITWPECGLLELELHVARFLEKKSKPCLKVSKKSDKKSGCR